MEISFRLVLQAIIVFFVCLIFVILVAAVLRRLLHSRKFRLLDKERFLYRDKLEASIRSGTILADLKKFIASPRSLKFHAIEDVLFDLINDAPHREAVKVLFHRLGYVSYYESKLNSRNSIVRASAIDKLGRMFSESSTAKLVEMLKVRNAETVSVAVRSLSKLKTPEGLRGILKHLPYLFRESLVTHKTVETYLINFGQDAVPVLIEFGKKYSDLSILPSVLEVLGNIPANGMATAFALENLSSKNAEMRAKSLKVLGRTDTGSREFDAGPLLPLLEDPVWFVRLQALRAIGKLKYRKAIDFIGGLLLDENWQVRNAAATALTKFEDAPLNIFLKILKYKDRYAKESICEEIEKTDFSAVLIRNLGHEDRDIYEKSKEILQIMHSLHFSTPLKEHVKTSGNERIVKEINLILNEEATA